MNARAAALVLASGSSTRRAMLENAGLAFIVDPPELDENVIKTMFKDMPYAGRLIAERLAADKAREISHRHPDALVIGADQTLQIGSRLLDKPRDRAEATRQLELLRGQTHGLTTVVAVAANGRILWHHQDMARLTMRSFSDAWLERYLDALGDEVTTTVGGYRLEGLGAQMFERIDGDWFTILGLPLLPLLNFLRDQGALAA